MEGSHFSYQTLNHVRFIFGILVDFESVGSVVHSVRFVVRTSADFCLNIHEPVSDAVDHICPVGTVDRYLFKIASKSVSVSIGIREKSSL